MKLAGKRTLVVAAALATVGLAAAGSSGSTPVAAPARGAIVTMTSRVPDPAPEAFNPYEKAPVTIGRGPGYTLLNPHIKGETPVGLNVWVSRHAAHRRKVAQAARKAVAGLRGMGIAIRWRGYGDPPPAEGVIRISEGHKGCIYGTDVVAMTWPQWQALPSGGLYMTQATTILCPQLFSRYHKSVLAQTVRHELGHAIGLAHTNYFYDGSYQIMNAGVRVGVVHYRAGDRRGVRALAAGSRGLKPVIPPAGRLYSSTYQSNNQIVFTGWSDLRFYPNRSVSLLLTDNGVPIASTSVRNARANSFRLATPWPGGTHRYCVQARSTVNRAAVTQLACVTWHS
jgi:hypothetical protein